MLRLAVVPQAELARRSARQIRTSLVKLYDYLSFEVLAGYQDRIGRCLERTLFALNPAMLESTLALGVVSYGLAAAV
jgi:hypothetical protein